MWNFIGNAFLWTLAFYGLFEIIRTIIFFFTYSSKKGDGIYLILAVKNQENSIEGFLRSVLFKILYGKENSIKEIIVTDLNSVDNTKGILQKMAVDYDCVKFVSGKECIEILEELDS